MQPLRIGGDPDNYREAGTQVKGFNEYLSFASVAELVDLPAGRQARWIRCRMMMWVYAIASVEHSYVYVGMTSNLEERLKRHNKGWERTTKAYKPFKLIYAEKCGDRIKARAREKYWKSGFGKEKLKILRDFYQS